MLSSASWLAVIQFRSNFPPWYRNQDRHDYRGVNGYELVSDSSNGMVYPSPFSSSFRFTARSSFTSHLADLLYEEYYLSVLIVIRGGYEMMLDRSVVLKVGFKGRAEGRRNFRLGKR